GGEHGRSADASGHGGGRLHPVSGAIAPYAYALNMGLNRDGLPSLKFRVRTLSFLWFIRTLMKKNPGLYCLPTVREFERTTPGMKEIAERDYGTANSQFIKTWLKLFTHHGPGNICFLSPMSGLAAPHKPALHPQAYRTLDLVQRKVKDPIPCYLMSTYPRLKAEYNYWAPLLSPHTLVMQEHFYLPHKDYESACTLIADRLQCLRQSANFTPPNYDRISRK
ncbi:MAG: hypothetical protein F6K09_31585, partial [Merismopedia sp. SIO2A8]|nr:hypothetical protein [Merismopedia sp. SIO2A8]